MENLEKLVQKQLEKAQNLRDFCNIVCDEEEKRSLFALTDELQQLQKNIKLVKEAIAEMPEMQKDFQEVVLELRRQDVIMKLVLEKVLDDPASQNLDPNMLTPEPKKQPMLQVQSSAKKLQWNKNQSVSAKKKSGSGCLGVNLLDFSFTITENEFNDIPKYVRGRDTLSELQRTIDEILCPCFVEKYSLLAKPDSESGNFKQRQLIRHFKDQQNYFPGDYFITEGDIARFTEALIDKKLRTRMQMLRHLGIIKETRKNSTTCFVWLVRQE